MTLPMTLPMTIPLFKSRNDKEAYFRLAGDCFDRGYVGEGPMVVRFEEELARILEVKPWQVVATNSGTAALQVALGLFGAGPGKEVVMSPVTCSADAQAVYASGAKIVWADVHARSGLLDSWDAARLLTPRTCAILATDWGGTTPDMKGCWEYPMAACSVPVIQDAAHNLTGRKYGDAVCYSFQGIKHLTTGDGGAVVLFNEKRAKEARLRRWFGLDRTSSADFRCSQNISVPGLKYHPSDLDACLGLANIPLALDSVARSRDNARWYQENLPDSVLCPFEQAAPYWIYTILVGQRDSFKDFMAERGIAVSPVHAPCTKHDLFQRYNTRDLPGVRWFSEHNVAIPNGYWVSHADRVRIAEAVREWVYRC